MTNTIRKFGLVGIITAILIAGNFFLLSWMAVSSLQLEDRLFREAPQQTTTGFDMDGFAKIREKLNSQ